jgi:rRNA processing protein Krr1/Pno1
MARDDIQKRLEMLEQQREELKQRIERSQNILIQADEQMADFKLRQSDRMADKPEIQQEHKQKIADAGNEAILP